MTLDAVLGRPELRVAPLARDTLQERAYRRICDLILDGEIAPGQVVTIQSLAEAFGVSAMPVREALKRLAASGALSLVTGRSIGVPRLSLDRLADLRRVRLAVEGLASEWAAELMEPDDLARLGEHYDLL
ncbi:MAG TPA: GntR family transcriptional regulator, partial [Roseiarcus sp.]|nr:GntR family transcriptional regulator [Roseiarcus sp.]